MSKRTILTRSMIVAALAVGFVAIGAADANAVIVGRRVAPVRRIAARAALPPYPVARRAVVGPVVRPVYRPNYRPVVAPVAAPVYAPAYYGPAYYGGGVSVRVGW